MQCKYKAKEKFEYFQKPKVEKNIIYSKIKNTTDITQNVTTAAIGTQILNLIQINFMKEIIIIKVTMIINLHF